MYIRLSAPRAPNHPMTHDAPAPPIGSEHDCCITTTNYSESTVV